MICGSKSAFKNPFRTCTLTISVWHMLTWSTFWTTLLSLFLNPLRTLYFRGPGWHSFGFWSGNAPEDICAVLTGVSASHWLHNTDACTNLIERKFHAFVLGFVFITLLLTGIYTFLCLMCRTCCLRPVLKVFQRRNISTRSGT